jgi:type IV pilus assembly protein PilQ
MKWMTKTSMILALAFLVMAGKATVVPYSALAAQDGIKTSMGKLAAIKSISVAGEGAATELLIVLSSPATYTSYKTTAPLRLVIDLSQASQGAINSPLVVNKGNFKTVTANRFDTDAGVLTRIDIELDKDAEAVISTSPLKPGELRISFPSLEIKPVSAPMDARPNLSSVQPEPVVEAPVAGKPATTTPYNQAAAVRRLKAITVDSDKIVLDVEGGVAEFNSFRLNKPERFVIDLLDTQLAMASRLIPLNSSGVASARIGLYPDKVRIVLDSVNGNFPEVSTVKSSQGLIVTLNSKTKDNINSKITSARSEKTNNETALTAATPKADQTTVITTKASAPESKVQSAAVKPVAAKTVSSAISEAATVEMIDFQVVDNISRVAVKVKGDVTVDPPVKSPGFVTLTVKNAGLSKQLQRSLETQSFISPVLRITPLLVKTRKGNDTKIRIAMRVVAPYEFRQEGDMIFVDFKNPEGITADKLPAAILDGKTQTPRSNTISKENVLASEIAQVSEASVMTPNSKAYKGRKVTLEFADAEVRKIFQLLSEVSNKNFVLGDDVTGTISIKLVNVPWDQALDIILDTKGFDKREDGNIFIIKGKGKFKSQADEEQDLKKALQKSIELKSEVFNINYSDLGSIAAQLNALKTERGTITQDSRTNKIIVKDIPQVLDDMRRFINQIDIPEQQVMIEARIVEASSTFSSSFGISWGVHANNPADGYIWGVKNFNMGFGGIASTPPPVVGVPGTAGGTMGISFGSIFGTNVNVDMRLNAAASAGLIKIVSTPKVATLNNKTAVISQGQSIPYQNTTSQNGAVTEFKDATLKLEVTPHINSNGTISMKINAQNDSPGVGNPPPINTKKATTEMLLRDGETTVIGGIFIDNDSDLSDGVPYLMDIPFLGKLFKSTNKAKVKSELLIFITPRILTNI